MIDEDRDLVEALLGSPHTSNVTITDRAAARLQALAARVKVLEAALSEHGGRYWEARYRDEGNEIERLRETLGQIAPHVNWMPHPHCLTVEQLIRAALGDSHDQ